MTLPFDPQIEAIKAVIREHDFRLALFFFVLEAVLLVWLLPKILEMHTDRKRVPARRIAANRIAESIRDLLRASNSFDLGISVANRIAKGEDEIRGLEKLIGNFNKGLDATIEHFRQLSGQQPSVPVLSPSPKQQHQEKDAGAKSEMLLNRAKNLFIKRNVDDLLQAIDDTENTIDVFVPIFSVEMFDSVAKLYQRLAELKQPYRALKRAFEDPNDAPSVVEASGAAIDSSELLVALKEFSRHVQYDASKIESECKPFTDKTGQLRKVDEFLFLHFENSPKQQRVKAGVSE
jgi:hypothetical protein